MSFVRCVSRRVSLTQRGRPYILCSHLGTLVTSVPPDGADRVNGRVRWSSGRRRPALSCSASPVRPLPKPICGRGMLVLPLRPTASGEPVSQQSSSRPEADRSDERLVLVGGGLAGAKAAQALREQGFEGTVTLIRRSSTCRTSGRRCRRATCSARTRATPPLVHPQDWYEQQGSTCASAPRSTALDPAAHEIELAGGERLPYAKPLLATGSVVNRLAVPGGTGRRLLRKLPDADHLKDTLAGGGPGRGDRRRLDRPGGHRRARVVRRGGHPDRGGPAAAVPALGDEPARLRRPAPRARRRPALNSGVTEIGADAVTAAAG